MNGRRRGERGQAVVEMALGLLVFVTVLVFAIYFSEVGYLSMKVQEAATSAMWDASGGAGSMMHAMPGLLPSRFDPTPSANTAAADAQTRYSDFDGRETTVGGSSSTNVFTRALNMQVQCQKGQGPNDGSWATSLGVGFIYWPNGGIGCSAQADIQTWKMPLGFLETNVGGTFKQKNYDAASTTMHVCSVGRASGGSCAGKYKLLVDDWGLEGPSETKQCYFIPNPYVQSPCINDPLSPYYLSVGILYTETSLLAVWDRGAATTMARTITKRPPPGLVGFPFQNEDAYWMTAPGENAPLAGAFNQIVMGLPPDNYPFEQASPGGGTLPPGISFSSYARSFGMRNKCFLGQQCM